MTRMTSSTPFSAGDVVRVAFTFTSQTGAKTRPAVVLSADAFHTSRADLIMMPLSTRAGGFFGDRALIDWQSAGLPRPTNIKAVIQTIPQAAILGHFGRLTILDIQQVKDALAEIIDLP
jgi:mRNA-degrading endonuclease toxin of MazEF toxin-antitoxin module